MPKLDTLLHPRCPNHPQWRAEPSGVCVVCSLRQPKPISEETKRWIEKLSGYARGRFWREGEDNDGIMHWEPRDG